MVDAPLADAKLSETKSPETESPETRLSDATSPDAGSADVHSADIHVAVASAATDAPPLAPDIAPEIAAEIVSESTPAAASPAAAAPVVTIDGPSVSAPDIAVAPASAPGIKSWMPKWPALHLPALSRQARRRTVLAASIAAAAGLGVAAGAVAVGLRTPSPTPAQQAKIAADRDAMQKTIDRLGKEVVTLRAGLDSAGKSANAQIAKLTAKVKEAEKAADEARRAAAAPETTGSIPAAVPMPVPKPAINPVTAAAKQPIAPPIVEGWFVHSARNGRVLVEGRGELYDVVPGAPLPGLGRVEAIRRENGQWVVVTQKGVIVAMREAPRPVYRRF